MHKFSFYICFHVDIWCSFCHFYIFHVTPCELAFFLITWPNRFFSTHKRHVSISTWKLFLENENNVFLPQCFWKPKAFIVEWTPFYTYGWLLLWFMMKLTVWHFVNATHKVMTFVIMLCSICYCGIFFAISWIYSWYICRVFTIMWHISCLCN